MSDDVKALIRRGKDEFPDHVDVQYNAREALVLIRDLAAALEASVQAPAVDREALAQVLLNSVPLTPSSRNVVAHQVEELIASDILQDAAEVEARGLSEFADWFVNTSSTVGGKPMFTGSEVAEILRGTKPFGMAQQVREGSADSKAGAVDKIRETMRQVAESDEKLAELYRKARGEEGN